MLTKVLVPLDDSVLSHGILTHVRRILLQEGAAVKLVRVLSRAELSRATTDEEIVSLARAHLSRVVTLLEERGIEASYELLVGDAAGRILDLAEDWQPSLMAMASHGRSGADRWIRGSVAERVLRGSRFPLLLSNPIQLEGDPWWGAPEGSRDLAREVAWKRILVPLDGSELSASILPLAADVARLHSSEIVLFHVHERGSPEDPKQTLDPYRRLLEGIPVTTRVAEGDPALAILDAASESLVDLVAMTTHGRSGISRWAFGSVAEHVIRHCASPLLVQRTAGTKGSPLPTE
jgi:nucleotide-binding universal stress UspA family protein